jgi:hypothetical protein
MLDLRGANLRGANLNEAELVRIILHGAALSQAHLSDANLEHTWPVVLIVVGAVLLVGGYVLDRLRR